MNWPEFFLGLFAGVVLCAGIVIFCLDRFGGALEGDE
jgi:hypothetical protein